MGFAVDVGNDCLNFVEIYVAEALFCNKTYSEIAVFVGFDDSICEKLLFGTAIAPPVARIRLAVDGEDYVRIAYWHTRITLGVAFYAYRVAKRYLVGYVFHTQLESWTLIFLNLNGCVSR